MIDDEHQRARAVLWCLADLDPRMPLIEALGYLRAVEDKLRALEEGVMKDRDVLPSWKGAHAAVNLVKDFASNSIVQAAARSGDVVGTAATLVKLTGAEVGPALLAGQTLVSLAAEA